MYSNLQLFINKLNTYFKGSEPTELEQLVKQLSDKILTGRLTEQDLTTFSSNATKNPQQYPALILSCIKQNLISIAECPAGVWPASAIKTVTDEECPLLENDAVVNQLCLTLEAEIVELLNNKYLSPPQKLSIQERILKGFFKLMLLLSAPLAAITGFTSGTTISHLWNKTPDLPDDYWAYFPGLLCWFTFTASFVTAKLPLNMDKISITSIILGALTVFPYLGNVHNSVLNDIPKTIPIPVLTRHIKEIATITEIINAYCNTVFASDVIKMIMELCRLLLSLIRQETGWKKLWLISKSMLVFAMVIISNWFYVQSGKSILPFNNTANLGLSLVMNSQNYAFMATRLFGPLNPYKHNQSTTEAIIATITGVMGGLSYAKFQFDAFKPDTIEDSGSFWQNHLWLIAIMMVTFANAFLSYYDVGIRLMRNPWLTKW